MCFHVSGKSFPPKVEGHDWIWSVFGMAIKRGAPFPLSHLLRHRTHLITAQRGILKTRN
jgi:hypothetical protein